MAFDFSRRTILRGMGIGLGTAALSPESVQGITESQTQIKAVKGAFAPEIPQDPSRPFLAATHGVPPVVRNRGWEKVDPDTLVDSMLGLGLDLFSAQALTGFSGPPIDTVLAYRHRSVAEFSQVHEIPHSVGYTPILEPETVAPWYQGLPDSKRWQRPNGNPVEHPRELAARHYDGEPQKYGDTARRVLPSMFAPGTIDLHAQIGAQLHQLGATHLFVDGIGLRFNGHDFSEWACNAFTDHLAELPSDRLDELGIGDPANFDVRDYLKDNGIAPTSDSGPPLSDPVYREFTLFQHRGIKNFVTDVSTRTRSNTPDPVQAAGTTFFGNQGSMSVPQANSIYTSDIVDYIDIEVEPTIPPNRPHDITVKVARAAGRFETPVRLEGKLQRIREMDTLHGLDPTAEYPTLMAVQVAQAYAHGGTRGLSMSGWADVHNDDIVNNWVREDGSIPTSLQRLADFVRANERYLGDTEPANETVVVVSLPTLIWQHAPHWEQYNPPHSDAIRGVATALRRLHVPYDVLILDDPAVWEAPDQYEALGEYEQVILPSVEHVSDAHVDAIRAALESGTHVIATGGAPVRDDRHHSRSDLEATLDANDLATVLESTPGSSGDSGTDSAFRDVIASGPRQVSLGTSGDVSVNVARPSDDTGTVVNLVNFEYDPNSDSMTERTDLDVTLQGVSFDPAAVTYHTPDGRKSVDYSVSEGAVTATIPRLSVWGFLVIHKDQPYSDDDSAATDRIDAAMSAIETARDEGRTEGLARASAEVENAERAFEYGAPEKSREAADAAIEAAENAYRLPVIGIDKAHNQSRASYDAELGTLRETFNEYDYRDVTSWTKSSFQDIDVLIVPPLTGATAAPFEFTQSELDAVQAFVERGGSLLVLGTNDPKSGINQLAGSFGVTFDGRSIMRKSDGDRWTHEVSTPLSAVTQFVPRWEARFGTALRETGDAAVLGRVADGQTAWYHETTPRESKEGDETSAVGDPVMVGLEHGAGHVIISGESQQFVHPTTHDDEYPAPLVSRVLRTLGQKASSTRTATEGSKALDSATKTADEKSTTTTSDGGQTTSRSVPGFSVLTGIAGIAGVLAHLAARARKNDD